MIDDKKLTDSEIVKLLECCYSTTTDMTCEDDCPLFIRYNKKHCGDENWLGMQALDLINRLQAKNERLLQKLQQAQAENERLKKVLKIKSRELKNKIKTCDELVEEKVMFSRKIKTAKAEAYKEFAERVKGAKQYCVERHENIVPVAVIDWILKELVGEE